MRTEYASGHRSNHHATNTTETRNNKRTADAAALWTLMGTALLAACAHDGEAYLDSGGGGHDGTVDPTQLADSLAIAGGFLVVGGAFAGGGSSAPAAPPALAFNTPAGPTISDTTAPAASESFTDPTGSFGATSPLGAVTYSVPSQAASALDGHTHMLAGTFGTLHFHETTGAWTFAINTQAVDALTGTDQGRTDTFAVTVTDTENTLTQNFVVTVNGADEPGPAFGTPTGAVIADTAARGETFANETGNFGATAPDGGTITYSVTGQTASALPGHTHMAAAGTYGTLHFNETTGAWTFVVNGTAVDALDHTDQGLTDMFAVTVTDNRGNEVTRTLVITVNGFNEPPIFTAPTGATVADTTAPAASESFTNPTGSFGATDPGDTLTYSVTGQAASSLSGHTHMVAGTYGTLHFHETTGAWTFVVNTAAVDMLRSMDTGLNDTFAVTVTDSNNNARTQDLVIAVTGADENVAPAFVPDQGQTALRNTQLNEGLDEGTVGARNGGRILVEDTESDLADLGFRYGIASSAAADDPEPARAASLSGRVMPNEDVEVVAGSFGTFTIRKESLTWEYDLNEENSTVMALTDGQILYEKLTVAVTDPDGGESDPVDLVVTIRGTAATNSPPVIFVEETGAGTEASGSDRTTRVDRAINKDHDVAMDGAVTGSVIFRDPDAADTNASLALTVIVNSGTSEQPAEAPEDTAEEDPTLSGLYGSFSLDRTNTDGTIDWTYTLTTTNTVVQALTQGQSLVEKLTIVMVDNGPDNTYGTGNDDAASAAFTVVITINGTGAASPGTNLAPTLEFATSPRVDGHAELEEDATAAVTGVLDFADDTTAAASIDSLEGTSSTTTTGRLPSAPGTLEVIDFSGGLTQEVEGTYGDFSLTRDNTAGTLTWSYALDSAKTDFSNVTGLSAGEALFERLVLAVEDDATTPLRSGNLTVQIRIEGANETPTLTYDNAPAGGNPSTDAVADTDEDATSAVSGGTFDFADTESAAADLTFKAGTTASDESEPAAHDTPAAITFTSNAATVAGMYGSFTLTRNNTDGTLVWTYTLSTDAGVQAMLQALDTGDEVFEKLVVVARDEDGADSAPLTALVTIAGDTDGPEATPSHVTGHAEKIADGMPNAGELNHLTLTAAHFGYSAPDAATLVSVTIVALPHNGETGSDAGSGTLVLRDRVGDTHTGALTGTTTDVTAPMTITKARIDAGDLIYRVVNRHADITDAIDYRLTDSMGRQTDLAELQVGGDQVNDKPAIDESNPTLAGVTFSAGASASDPRVMTTTWTAGTADPSGDFNHSDPDIEQGEGPGALGEHPDNMEALSGALYRIHLLGSSESDRAFIENKAATGGNINWGLWETALNTGTFWGDLLIDHEGTEGSTGAWSFAVDDDAAATLGATDTKTLKVRWELRDGEPDGSTFYVWVFELSGVNDAPTLGYETNEATDGEATVPNIATDGDDASGTLEFVDVDMDNANADLTITAAAAGAATEAGITMPTLTDRFPTSTLTAMVEGEYGTFNLTRDNTTAGSDGTLAWSYDLDQDDTTVSGLTTGSIYDKLFVQVGDGSLMSAVVEVLVEIEKTNALPRLGETAAGVADAAENYVTSVEADAGLGAVAGTLHYGDAETANADIDFLVAQSHGSVEPDASTTDPSSLTAVTFTAANRPFHMITTEYGRFTIDRQDSSSEFRWSYTPDFTDMEEDAHFRGHKLFDKLTVWVDDGNTALPGGRYGTPVELVVTIIGEGAPIGGNAPPVVYYTTSNAADGNGTIDEDDTGTNPSGSFDFFDFDSNETIGGPDYAMISFKADADGATTAAGIAAATLVAVPTNMMVVGTYGTFTLARTNPTTAGDYGKLTWEYDVDEANTTVQALNDGGTLYEQLTLVASEGTDDSAAVTALIEITGVTDMV